MTEDEMMQLNQIKQQNDDLRRKSVRNGGCCGTILGIILIFVLGACSMSKDSHTIIFSKLNKSVQDTLISVSQKVLEEDYSPQSMIDFSGNCKLIEKHIGPWIVEIQIKDTTNKTNITLPSNAPAPYIVYNNFVYYPREYNLFVLGLKVILSLTY